ncbi:MAG: aldehyde dehydrogenase [Bacteroidales bacterium]|nr:aldehyde dehydrogenase [Bacteroidales bacterium]
MGKYTAADIKGIRLGQEAFFKTHTTKNVSYRMAALKKLKEAIHLYEKEITEALYKDLKKQEFESFSNEVGVVLEEISLHIKKIENWSMRKWVPTNQLVHFFSRSYIQPEPYGQVLIIAPWNYPFQLLMSPLVGAISAGNTVVLKPSELTVQTTSVINKIISATFESEYIKVVEGGIETSQHLLEQKWDHIFFTGSPKVGKIVMRAAAEHLTPVTLELGGKSPAIVNKDANLKLSAQRLMWGKLLNAGQTCIAPDYAFVHHEIKDEFIEHCKSVIHQLFGDNPKQSDLPRISSEANVLRLQSLLKDASVIYGGQYDMDLKYFAPTILNDVEPEDAVMQQEIFGPILPVMSFETLDEVISFVNERPKPLALYYFGRNTKDKERILMETSSGGVMINDTLMQFVHQGLPFGGIGNSGMGSYHGKSSFDTFSHFKPLIKKSTAVDVPVRYAPYTAWKLKLAKLIMK